jgi:iron complex outermembrane recepter protein
MNRQGLAVVLLAMMGAGFSASAQDTTAPTGQEASAPAAQGASILTGKVTSQAGEPLPGASVTLTPGGATATTDEKGFFQIEAPPGKYDIDASFAGIASATKNGVVLSATPTHVEFALADESLFSDTIVVVGSRTARSVTRSPVPIDTISSEQILESGETETNQILRTVAPSYNASHQTIADGTDHIDPASLRGLGPDQVLVLLNGKRRHPSALVNVNGTFGRGTVGTDMNAIPTTAIRRIEILRDGASAQYGSDAIAGVVNVQLKETPGELSAAVTTGLTGGGDGAQLKTGLSYGIPVGKSGVVHLTGELLLRGATDRSGEYTGNFYPGVTDPVETDRLLAENGLDRKKISLDVGQSKATAGMLFYNAKIPVGTSFEIYGAGGGGYRVGKAGGIYRRPNQPDRIVASVYPNGFLPEIHPTSIDWQGGLGVRSISEPDEFMWDASITHGGNWFNFDIKNSINSSLGEASPREFNSGGFSFSQTTANVDLVEPLKTPLKKLALNGGAEYRVDNYRIRAGDEASWILGPVAGKQAGAQVFPGFQPSNVVNKNRNSFGGYLGLETEFGDLLMVDLAGRFERFDDFGSTINGKVAARLQIIDALALRAAASTGFRAPSLQQVYFNNTSTQFVTVGTTQEAREVLTANNASDVARAFGIPRLKQETSRNVSAGVTITPAHNFTFTADTYLIDISDRIVLTSQFTQSAAPGTGALLAPFNAAAAQFFSNAVDTRTFGTDVVVEYDHDFSSDVKLGLTGAASFSRTRVMKVNIPQGVADVFAGGDLAKVGEVVFSREERGRLEVSVPQLKGLIQGRLSYGKFVGLLRANYWGNVSYLAIDPLNDEFFGAKMTYDAELGYSIMNGLKVAVGGTNIFNTYPFRQLKAGNISDGQFIYSRRVSQFGMNGGFYYGRLEVLF